METLTKALFACALVAITTACKKDHVGAFEAPPMPAAPLEVAAFSHLEVGNYWVYERMQVDSLDVPQGLGQLDSLYVDGDTLLDGEILTILRMGINGQPGTGVRYYWRDSADCIVDRYHMIQFRSTHFGEVFGTENSGGQSGVIIEYAIPLATVPISVPAGNFDTYLVLGSCTSFGSFPIIPEWKYPRDYWAEGAGRVKWYDYFASGDLGFRYQLVSYYVQ